MAFQKGHARIGGDRTGVPNKITRTVKEAIVRAYDYIGGDVAFGEWAKEERTEFYKLYAKLLPKELELKYEEDIAILERQKQIFDRLINRETNKMIDVTKG